MTAVYFLNNIMGNVFGTQSTPSLPTNYWLGLSTTAPSTGGGNVTEPTGGAGYGRVQLTSLSLPVNGSITNSAAVVFNESTASWGLITHYVIYGQQTGGNLLMYGPLTVSRTVEINTVVTIKPNELVITLENIIV